MTCWIASALHACQLAPARLQSGALAPPSGFPLPSARSSFHPPAHCPGRSDTPSAPQSNLRPSSVPPRRRSLPLVQRYCFSTSPHRYHERRGDVLATVQQFRCGGGAGAEARMFSGQRSGGGGPRGWELPQRAASRRGAAHEVRESALGGLEKTQPLSSGLRFVTVSLPPNLSENLYVCRVVVAHELLVLTSLATSGGAVDLPRRALGAVVQDAALHVAYASVESNAGKFWGRQAPGDAQHARMRQGAPELPAPALAAIHARTATLPRRFEARLPPVLFTSLPPPPPLSDPLSLPEDYLELPRRMCRGAPPCCCC